MLKDPKLLSEDEEAIKVAKALGVDLGEKYTKEKGGKESNPDKKTDTGADEEEGREGNPGKSDDDKKKEDAPDYKKMYADSTKEFQDVWKPVKDKLDRIEKISGKSIDSIVEEYEKVKGNEGDKKKDTPVKGEEEETEQLTSIEKRLITVEDKQKEMDEQDQVAAKKVIDTFKAENDISEDNYKVKYNPLLDGIKAMRKENGEPYTLEEGLKIAYIIVNKDNIDKVVEQKIKIMDKEKDLAGFSPSSKAPSDVKEEGTYSESQQDFAKKMGVDLKDEEESSS